MAVLRAAVAVVALAGCYQPQARDCTVSCAGADDCLPDQVCGTDGWCAAPDVAGSCGERPIDAAIDPDGAEAIDAEPQGTDAGGAELRVVVDGRGKVVVEPLGVECAGEQNVPGDCTFPVALDTQVTLLPVDTHPVFSFSGWTTDNCLAARSECVLTIEAPVTLVGAAFD